MVGKYYHYWDGNARENKYISSTNKRTHWGCKEKALKKCYESSNVINECYKSYKANPFDNALAQIMTTGVKACSKIVKGLLQAPEQGNKGFLNFSEN